MADDRKQRLVYSVIEFLNDSIADGTVKEEDKESLEVASTSESSYHKYPAPMPAPP